MKSYLEHITLSKITFFVLCTFFGVVLGSVPLIIISASLAILMLLEKYINIKIPSIVSIVFVLSIVFALVLGSYFNFYEKFYWWDDLLHGFYGGAFALLGFFVIQYFGNKRGVSNDVLLICLFSLCFSITCGVIWEIYEYCYDILLNGNMQRTDQGSGVSDTMNDLILESSVAVIVNIYIYGYLKSGANNWVAKLAKSFKDLNAK